ncbi:MAG: hypothetical protein J6D21_10845 [Clostridia bacterium]|nr:hypothetical protein [Clostridia bacterium]
MQRVNGTRTETEIYADLYQGLYVTAVGAKAFESSSNITNVVLSPCVMQLDLVSSTLVRI